jgi:transcriptional regulator with XRE-family HTH domain
MIEGADPGLERAFLSLLENGRSDLTLSSLEKLADAFGLTISELMKGL